MDSVLSLIGMLLVNLLPWHDSRIVIFLLDDKNVTHSAQMQVHLSVVISYRGPWLYISFVLGVANDGHRVWPGPAYGLVGFSMNDAGNIGAGGLTPMP